MEREMERKMERKMVHEMKYEMFEKNESLYRSEVEKVAARGLYVPKQ